MTVRLSTREAEIVALVAEGKRVNEIGRELYLTPDTVRSYLKRARGKYRDDGRDTGTLILLVRRAIEDGQIPPILPRIEAAL